MIAELVVAEKLGYTLGELRQRMCPEELSLWMMFYDLRQEQEKKQMEQAATSAVDCMECCRRNRGAAICGRYCAKVAVGNSVVDKLNRLLKGTAASAVEAGKGVDQLTGSSLSLVNR